MKKQSFVILVIIILSVLCSINGALSEPRKFPEDVNTDTEITFPGFEWYSDYPAVLKAAEERGFSDQSDHFDPQSIEETPHWKYIFGWTPNISGAERGCGGHVSFLDVPQVGGYDVHSAILYMMWDPKKGAVEDYKNEGALQLYMAKYVFCPADTKGCYEDLVTKLKTVYGEKPTQTTWGSEGIDYSYWLNGDGGMIVISYSKERVVLLYCGPGSDEKLVQVEEKVAQTEIDNAAGQMNGL